MPRLGYRKSRNGCQKCRQRRVKCDEKHPCTACQRHGIVCSLMEQYSESSSASVRTISPQIEVRIPNPVERGDPGELGDGSTTNCFQTSTRSRKRKPATPGSTVSPPTPTTTTTTTLPLLQMPLPSLRDLESEQEQQEQQEQQVQQQVQQQLQQQLQQYSAPLRLPPPTFIENGDGQSISPDEWAMDLGLMLHFTTQAYQTLPRSEEVRNIWQVQTVEIAIAHRYLLHQILAFSAFHLAFLRPSQRHRYYYSGMQHQRQGVSEMRSVLGQLNAENCHALFMSASFLILSSFAALSVETDMEFQRPSVEAVVEMITLIKGMSTVLNSWDHAIHVGPFAKLFEFSPGIQSSGGGGGGGKPTLFSLPSTASLASSESPSSSSPQTDPSTRGGPSAISLSFITASSPPSYTNSAFWDDVDVWLNRLQTQIDGRLSCDPPQVAPQTAKIVSGEIRSLAATIQSCIASTSQPEMRCIMYWPSLVTDGFTNLLRDKEPAALALLAHYCVLVHATESKSWYTNGWGTTLLRAVESALPPTWFETIEWPRSRIFNRAVVA